MKKIEKKTVVINIALEINIISVIFQMSTQNQSFLSLNKAQKFSLRTIFTVKKNRGLNCKSMILIYLFLYPNQIQSYHIVNNWQILQYKRMQIHRRIVVDQYSAAMQILSTKNTTTKSICGYVVCAIAQYIIENNTFILNQLNQQNLYSYIDKVMGTIQKYRKQQIKKYYKIMNNNDKESYMTDWIAAFEIADYIENIQDKTINPYIYFFRQVAYDHPDAMLNIKYEQAERVKEQQKFKGEKYFYSSFNPYENHHKEKFQQILRVKEDNLPIVIITDVLGHFNVTVLFQGQVYSLDSLVYVQGQYDYGIIQAIAYYYRQSYIQKQENNFKQK